MAIITDKSMGAKPTGADQWLTDDSTRGTGKFLGRITAGGERGFYFRHTKADGERDTLRIGGYDPKGANGLTLAQARAVATEWRTIYPKVTKNLRQHFLDVEAKRLQAIEDALAQALAERAKAIADAQAAELEQQRRLSVRQLFERWAATELKSHVRGDGKRVGRKDGGQYVREQFERRVFPSLGAVAAIAVTQADVWAILDAVKAEGKLRTANVLLGDLRQMFAFAAEREIIEHSPVVKIKKKKVGGVDVERDRVLTPDEISALAKALPQSSLQHRSQLAIWLVLATACRIGELMGAEWKQIDLVARTLYLPDTKTQRDHTIHLSDFALEQLEKLSALREADEGGRPLPWLFPNTAGTGPVCIKSFGKQLADRQRDPSRRMTNRAKDTTSLTMVGGRWTAHDLRRTAATLMAGMGVSTDVVDECLNHKLQSKVARTYIKDRRLGEQARAFDALGAKLAALVTDTQVASNIVSIRAA